MTKFFQTARQLLLSYHLIFLIGSLLVILPFTRSHDVITSQTSDIANHVRHIYEYKLALMEGQFPPLVAPLLNEAIRIPIFQFYSGTAFTLSGLITLLGINPYVAMIIPILVFSWLATVCVYHTLQIVVKDQNAALIGALAYQLAIFPQVDLFDRGGFPEWLSLQYLTIVFFLLIKISTNLLNANNKNFVSWGLLLVLTLLMFIPCHPLQTLYAGFFIR